MQLPHRNTPITRCETASKFTQGAMRRYAAIFDAPPETAARLEDLADTLEAATTALVDAQAAYRATSLALVAIRLEVKLMDLRADDEVRKLKRAADSVARDVSSFVFPKGLTPIVRPLGQTQVAALRALEGRIAAATKWAERQQAVDRVVAVREQYEAALANRQEAMVVNAAQRATRDGIKEDFLDAFAAVAGAVRELFPRDRRRQDVFFDVLRTSRSSNDDTDEPDEPVDPAPTDE